MNMSYCAVENTAGAMRQVIDLMEEFDTIKNGLRASTNTSETDLKD